MKQRMTAILIGLALIATWATGFAAGPSSSAKKLTDWQLAMMDYEYFKALLSAFEGKTSKVEYHFADFLETIRMSMLENNKYREYFWQELEPILKTLSPAPKSLTKAEFDTTMIVLASSLADFGPVPTKLIWPEEIAPLTEGAPDFEGVYIGLEQVQPANFGQKIYLFPAVYVMICMHPQTNEEYQYGWKELQISVIHEFLHHLARVLYLKRLLPENFFEQQTILMTPIFLTDTVYNTYEHLWIYKVEQILELKLHARLSDPPMHHPTMVRRWLANGKRSPYIS